MFPISGKSMLAIMKLKGYFCFTGLSVPNNLILTDDAQHPYVPISHARQKSFLDQFDRSRK